MRLIDADLLKTHIAAAVLDGEQKQKDRASALFRVIESMPTAYDVDRVVEQLEKCEEDSCNVDYIGAMIEAIEIVKVGGVNE